MPVINLPTIVKGNTFSLAIPLQVYIVQDDELVLVDYVPESGDNITVRLKGERRNYTYIPSTNGNTAFIQLEGSEVVGMYAVEVVIVKDNDMKLTSFRLAQLNIVESIDELNEGQITDGIEQGAVYLDPEIFIAGKDGRGIVSIVKTSTIGLVDTYTITYTDNTTSTFNVTNGKDGINGQNGVDGADGVGIASIAKTGTQGLVDTYTITLTNGTTYTYQVTNGKDGENGRDGEDGQDGTDGVGIVSITKTSTSGLVDTYTILLTNGTTTTFTVTNGSDATQVQSDWSQSDSTAVDFIKNKPTIPAAQVQSNWNESDTSSKAYIQNKPTIPTIPATATQSEVDAGNSTSQRTFTPQLLHDNAYIVEESYSSGSLKANKMYDFGTVSTALTIPSLDATNDLVSNALNFYALRFIAGADNISITFPTGVIVDDTPTINTGDYVEIMINLYVENNTNHFYASIKVWQAQ